MQTECCECDKIAVGFHGKYAYCATHLREAQEKEPDAHSCPQCGTRQWLGVMWRGDKPCMRCQSK